MNAFEPPDEDGPIREPYELADKAKKHPRVFSPGAWHRDVQAFGGNEWGAAYPGTSQWALLNLSQVGRAGDVDASRLRRSRLRRSWLLSWWKAARQNPFATCAEIANSLPQGILYSAPQMVLSDPDRSILWQESRRRLTQHYAAPDGPRDAYPDWDPPAWEVLVVTHARVASEDVRYGVEFADGRRSAPAHPDMVDTVDQLRDRRLRIIRVLREHVARGEHDHVLAVLSALSLVGGDVSETSVATAERVLGLPPPRLYGVFYGCRMLVQFGGRWREHEVRLYRTRRDGQGVEIVPTPDAYEYDPLCNPEPKRWNGPEGEW